MADDKEMVDKLEPVVLKTAKDFLTELHPTTSSRWGEFPMHKWIFRGCSNAKWPLIPKALRAGKLEPFVFVGQGPSWPADAIIGSEHAALVNFMATADEAGLPIPEDGQWIRGTGYGEVLDESLKFGEKAHRWPPRKLLSILALAQHHGLPTRLLDWSWRSRIAAYFAALETDRDDPGPPADELAVWALRVSVIDSIWSRPIGDPEEPTVALVTAPRASNSFLGAQAGVFTVDRSAAPRKPLEERIWTDAFDARSKGTLRTEQWPPLFKFVLPRTEAKKLLRLLAFEGVTAATVFPGYRGAVDALCERITWEKG